MVEYREADDRGGGGGVVLLSEAAVMTPYIAAFNLFNVAFSFVVSMDAHSCHPIHRPVSVM